MSPILVWFRSDLRIDDNTALSQAAARGPVIAVFLRSSSQWQRHGHGPNKLDFWARGVAALRDDLAGLNIPLLHRTADNFEDAAQVLLTVAREQGTRGIYFNREYPLNERRRDQTVLDAFEEEGLEARGFTDSVAFAPGELLTGQGDYYRVFTPFAKAWHRQLEASRIALRDTPSPQPRLAVDSDPLPELSKDASIANATLWPAGQAAAASRLERFLRYRARHYHVQRDFPAQAGTSELSPYLALGMISARQCLQAVLAENQGGLSEGDAGLVAWVNELIWREFYLHLVVGFPDLCRGRPFQTHTEGLAWRDDDAAFRAWCEGRTGYPLVDAAMRQLVTTGWMHNRLRMVTAMFLSKHLLIDWRRGEGFYMHHLVDGDFAANNGGWQWAASTGTDAAPYFRIFNPVTQSKRFDPDGTFIGHYVETLQDVPGRLRHDPSQEVRRRTGYPSPIVDHKAARARALEAFKSLG